MAPVLFFLPARDEAPTVGEVLGRIPTEVFGRRVERLVIDDGSTDATADIAVAAGAEVVRHPTGQGLGAAVRRGLEEAVARRAGVVVFCDADGEYDPAELARVVAPIVEGRADYVVGSRFAGLLCHMHRHRRIGNRALTAMLSLAAGRTLSDGQSGYRALSGPAAAAARIDHDYNYAQVLTLDLLARGVRYAEVPISYRRRQSGRSFVRTVPYLCRVIPAVLRQVTARRPQPSMATPRVSPVPVQVSDCSTKGALPMGHRRPSLSMT